MEIKKVPSGRVIIEPIPKTVTDWGFELPDDEGDPIQEGIVRGIGEPVKNKVYGLKNGDYVLFKRAAGREFEFKEKERTKKLIWVRPEFIYVKIDHGKKEKAT